MSSRLGLEKRVKLAASSVVLASAVVLCTVRIVGDVVALAARGKGTFEAPGPWVDWQTYVNALHRTMHGLAIYSQAQLDGPYLLTHVVLTGYAYPPPSVFIFIPFATYPLGLIAWLTLNLGLFFSALWGLASCAWPKHRVLLLAALITWLSFYLPFTDGVESANVNVGFAGIVGWIALGARPTYLGVSGAAGALTKVFPAVLAAATPAGKLRSIGIAIGISMAAVAVTLPIVGFGAWQDFSQALSGAVPDCYGENLSLACSLRFTGGVGAGTAAGIAVGVLATMGLLIVRDTFWLAVLSAVAVIAPVTNLHLHYWLVIPVLLLAGVVKWRRLRGGRPPLALVARTTA